MRGEALALMARAPLPGRVKTRLHPFLTYEQCASLYHCLLSDAIELSMAVKCRSRFLAYAPEEATDFFPKIIPRGIELIPQRQGDIGQRMLGIIDDVLDAGHGPVIIIGSDIPLLQPSLIEEAYKRLAKHDLCFGPARDGGYYLIGAHSSWKSIFEGIPWSTPEVLDTTLARARAADLSVALLDECPDLDTIDDLRRLRQEFEKLRRTPGARLPRNTESWLNNWDVSSPSLCHESPHPVVPLYGL